MSEDKRYSVSKIAKDIEYIINILNKSTLNLDAKATIKLNLATANVTDGFAWVISTYKPVKQRVTRQSTNTGLGKLRVITQQLATFLDCDMSCQKSRNDVTKAICKYITDNKLQDTQNKKLIRCDDTLVTLLKLENNKLYSYTDIQSHFNHLFYDPLSEINIIPEQKFITFLQTYCNVDANEQSFTQRIIYDLVYKYVTDNNLKDRENKRKIFLNDVLKELFSYEPTSSITKLQLEKQMGKLFRCNDETEPELEPKTKTKTKTKKSLKTEPKTEPEPEPEPKTEPEPEPEPKTEPKTEPEPELENENESENENENEPEPEPEPELENEPEPEPEPEPKTKKPLKTKTKTKTEPKTKTKTEPKTRTKKLKNIKELDEE